MKKYDLDGAIRKVPNFPHEGILFYDISSVLMQPEAFRFCIDEAVEFYKGRGIDAIAAIDARGFLFATPIAMALDIPVILVRKAGKLPGKTIEKSYALEYGESLIQIQADDVKTGSNILIIDDLIATGGTIRAAADMLIEAGAQVKDVFGVIGLPFLKYKDVLSGIHVKTLVEYWNE